MLKLCRHNEDGSYTYGYEGADGSFKIETKLATGEVRGKYGYVDADNKVDFEHFTLMTCESTLNLLLPPM